MNRRSVTLAAGLMASLAMLPSPAAAAGSGSPTVTVCPSCEVRTPQEGLSRLAPGGTLRVESGRYRGPIVVDRPAHLVGVGNPVLDGNGRGTVVRLRAAGSSIQGFTVRGSGENLDHEDTGISLEAARQTVRDNRLTDVLFGVYGKRAAGSRIEGNTVTGKHLSTGEKGDGIRVWNSPSTTIAGNTTRRVRDNLLWFSDGSTISGNRFYDSRYAIHVMWSDDCTVTRNRVTGNSVGTYFMYSTRLRLIGNTFQGNRGSTGVGVGLRDSDYVTGSGNVFTHNRVGLWLFNSPRSAGAVNRFHNNLFAYNDIGVSAESTTAGDVFTGNDFVDNLQQVGGGGETSLSGIAWSEKGRGNYWSDYAGYDADGDGIGDTPYAPQRSFDSLVDRNADFGLLFMSPAAKAIDWAASVFPVFASSIPFKDPTPATKPVTTVVVAKPKGRPMPLLGGAGGLTLLGLALVGTARPLGTRAPSKRRPGRPPAPPAAGTQAAVIAVSGLRKAYGEVVILDDLSFEVGAGEVVALWGDNGAGKTTVLRCLLGLVNHEGQARIGGFAARTDPRRALAQVGHVSQEPAFHGDLTLTETLAFYARLHGATQEDQDRVLDLVGLRNAAGKQVAALSGGMHRKLAVAVALMGDPRVLLLDEPTANLDRQSRRDLVALLGGLKASGIAMVLATHQADEVLDLADRVLKLEAGRPATVVNTATFGRTDTDRRSALVVPEARREEAARLLLDAGIPLDEGEQEDRA